MVIVGNSHYLSLRARLPVAAMRRRRIRLSNLALAVIASCLALPCAAAVTCSVSATTVAFGVYNPLNAAPAVTTGTVTATCTLLSGGNTTVSLVSSYSTGSSGSYAARKMLSGANQLSYNLYFDAAYTQVRGDGTGGSGTGAGTLNLTNGSPTQSVSGTLYGRAPAAQDVAAGSYSDTITVTVTY